MLKSLSILATLSCVSLIQAQTISPEAPDGSGQLETPPTPIAGGIDEGGRTFSYNGQPSKNAKIILTASNGFFTKGVCKASGKSTFPKVGDESLIAPNFAWLENWKKTDGTLRWHFHIRKPGPIRLNVHLAVEPKQAGSVIEFQFAGESKKVATTASNGTTPQPWDLIFDAPAEGEYCLALQADKITDPATGVGKLARIETFGPAIKDAHLLRARWRPAAVHGGYDSTHLENSSLLVMTTRSTQPVSSYSPITTPFGYFGSSFTAAMKCQGNFNLLNVGKHQSFV